MAGLTAADVRAVVFGRPGFGKRGYHPAEVDDFLDRLAAALPGAGGGTGIELNGQPLR